MKEIAIQAGFAIAFLVIGVGVQPQQVEKKPDAQSRKTESRRDETESRRRPVEILTRQELNEFIRANHPELEKLLDVLETNRPDRYRAARRSLSRSVQRVQALEENEPEKYEAALRQWKIRSRINLTAVQLGMANTLEKRKELKSLIAQSVDHKKKQLEMEAKRLRRRLARVENRLVVIGEKRDQEIDRQFAIAMKSATRVLNSRPKDGPGRESKKPADK